MMLSCKVLLLLAGRRTHVTDLLYTDLSFVLSCTVLHLRGMLSLILKLGAIVVEAIAQLWNCARATN